MKKNSDILIVFASEREADFFINKISEKGINIKEGRIFKVKNSVFEVLISGMGIPFTMYSLTKKISCSKYDLVVNAGICGAYGDDLCIGDTVSIVLDEFADIGVTFADNSFKTLFEEGLLNPNKKPFSRGKLYNPLKGNIDTDLPKVTAITVNNVSGNREQIKFRKEKFNPDVESMEGAAVAYVCFKEKINFLQIRTVSNKVEERNKENWDINLALENLSEELFRIINNISD